jgi:hypothetical protein
MIRPTFPGFAAESALNVVNEVYKRSAAFGGETEPRVVPALPPRDSDTPGDNRIDCIQACRESGLSAAECSKKCTPQSTPGYQCTMQDNSYNHALCLGGMWAWEIACVSECSLLNVAIPGLGAGLSAACGAGCHALGEQMRSTCPPPSICV